MVRDKRTSTVKQLILPSYYLEWIFHAKKTEEHLEIARTMDIVWNFAAAVARMDTTHQNYFQWKVAQSTKEIRNDWVTMKGNDLWKARVMLGWEKKNQAIDEQTVRETFSSWLGHNSNQLNPEDGSLCRQIFMVLSSRTWAANKEQGHPGLKAGRITHALRLEAAAEAKWEVLMTNFVPEWERSSSAQLRTSAEKCHNANHAPWRERGKLMSGLAAAKHITLYSKSHPDGIRYRGDGGPAS